MVAVWINLVLAAVLTVINASANLNNGLDYVGRWSESDALAQETLLWLSDRIRCLL